MATQSDFNFHLNTKSLLHADYEGISFFWEAGEDALTIEGRSYDRAIYLPKSSAAVAKRAMVKFIGETFNV
ncbi:MAG: hypothetical protein [Inoviridae sp.]|nr:MAG: hypothetical protein [Inoviridae sp.]